MLQTATEYAFLSGHYRRADRLMLPLLWAMFAMTLFLAPWWNTWTLAYTLGLAFAAFPTALILLKPGSRMTRLSVGVSFMLFSALHIHQSMGVTELHFGIFVLLAVLLCYRDWLVIVTAAGVAALHHLSFNYLQGLGWNTICFAEPGFGRVLAHAAYVVVETAVLSYIAVWLQREAVQEAELQQLVSRLSVQQDGSVNLAIDEDYESEGAWVLAGALQEVRTAVERVRGAAWLSHALLGRIGQHGAAVQEGADRQAALADGAARAMEEINRVSRQNVALAEKTVDQAREVSRRVEEGGEVMRESVATMDRISESSAQISSITDVIDGIAFQTNILALNAAVEAARAGEAGRGFAVVASEVRSLAQRSAGAAKEIRALIETSSQQVEQGSARIHRAQQVMAGLLQEVRELGVALEESRGSSERQSALIDELAMRVQQICEIARDNQGVMGQASAAVSRLEQATEGLVESVQIFNVENERPHQRGRGLTAVAAVALPSSAIGAA